MEEYRQLGRIGPPLNGAPPTPPRSSLGRGKIPSCPRSATEEAIPLSADAISCRIWRRDAPMQTRQRAVNPKTHAWRAAPLARTSAKKEVSRPWYICFRMSQMLRSWAKLATESILYHFGIIWDRIGIVVRYFFGVDFRMAFDAPFFYVGGRSFWVSG